MHQTRKMKNQRENAVEKRRRHSPKMCQIKKTSWTMSRMIRIQNLNFRHQTQSKLTGPSRQRPKRDPDFVPQLKRLGLHPQEPFSAKYPFGGILDAVCPDLLHQTSKGFMDYLLEKWILPLMQWHGEKQQPKASNEQVSQQFDARFALMPSAMQLRRFPSGIFADNQPLDS